MSTTYNVTSALLSANVITLELVTVAGLRPGYTVHVDEVGQHFDGNHVLTTVNSTLNTVTAAFNHANIAEFDCWGQLNITVTWCDTADVTDFLGVAPAEPVDEAWLEACTEAANVWCWDRRQAAGYTDVPGVAPSHKVRLGAVMKSAELYRQRGSIDGYASFQSLESVAPVSTNVEVLRLLGINRPAVA